MTSHYHVRTHSDDEDPFVTDDLFMALDYAAGELDQLVNFEHEGVIIVVENVKKGYQGLWQDNTVTKHEMEHALLALDKSERYVNVMLNCKNMVKQKAANRADRAPLYQTDWLKGSDDEYHCAIEAADARLFEAAKRIAQMVNDDTPATIGECTAEMRTWPDEDQLHGGESYCADEYPDGYTG